MSWRYKDELIEDISQIPNNAFGFIYLIENLTTEEFYIGKKHIYANRTLPPLKGKKRKRKVTKESNWLTYQSSNDEVKSWKRVKRIILKFTFSKKETTYQETRYLFKFDALENKKCVNNNIAAKYFKGEFSSPGK